MAVDPELKGILNVVVDMQGRQADRLVAVENALVKLADGQELLRQEVKERVGGLERQVKAHTDAVTRSFTEIGGRYSELEHRLSNVETRLEQLEGERRT